jgi:hypothetical protein
MPLLLVAPLFATSISSRKTNVGLFVPSGALVCCFCCFFGDGGPLFDVTTKLEGQRRILAKEPNIAIMALKSRVG